jgi:hypothetical protein
MAFSNPLCALANLEWSKDEARSGSWGSSFELWAADPRPIHSPAGNATGPILRMRCHWRSLNVTVSDLTSISIPLGQSALVDGNGRTGALSVATPNHYQLLRMKTAGSAGTVTRRVVTTARRATFSTSRTRPMSIVFR